MFQTTNQEGHGTSMLESWELWILELFPIVLSIIYVLVNTNTTHYNTTDQPLISHLCTEASHDSRTQFVSLRLQMWRTSLQTSTWHDLTFTCDNIPKLHIHYASLFNGYGEKTFQQTCWFDCLVKLSVLLIHGLQITKHQEKKKVSWP